MKKIQNSLDSAYSRYENKWGIRANFFRGFWVISAAICCIVPAFMGKPLYIDSSYEVIPLLTAIRSISVREALVASLSVSSLLMLEFWLDILSPTKRKYIFRLFRITIILVPNMILYFVILPKSSDYMIRFIPGIILSQTTLFICTLAYSIIIFGSPIWKPYKTNVITAIFCAATFMDAYAAFNGDIILVYIKYILLIIGSILYGWKSLEWCFHVRKSCSQTSKPMTHDQYCCSVYVISGQFFLLMAIYNNIYYNEIWSKMKPDNLAYHIYTGLCILSLVSVLIDRVLRRDLATAEVCIFAIFLMIYNQSILMMLCFASYF